MVKWHDLTRESCARARASRARARATERRGCSKRRFRSARNRRRMEAEGGARARLHEPAVLARAALLARARRARVALGRRRAVAAAARAETLRGRGATARGSVSETGARRRRGARGARGLSRARRPRSCARARAARAPWRCAGSSPCCCTRTGRARGPRARADAARRRVVGRLLEEVRHEALDRHAAPVRARVRAAPAAAARAVAEVAAPHLARGRCGREACFVSLTGARRRRRAKKRRAARCRTVSTSASKTAVDGRATSIPPCTGGFIFEVAMFQS